MDKIAINDAFLIEMLMSLSTRRLAVSFSPSFFQIGHDICCNCLSRAAPSREWSERVLFDYFTRPIYLFICFELNSQISFIYNF